MARKAEAGMSLLGSEEVEVCPSLRLFLNPPGMFMLGSSRCILLLLLVVVGLAGIEVRLEFGRGECCLCIVEIALNGKVFDRRLFLQREGWLARCMYSCGRKNAWEGVWKCRV